MAEARNPKFGMQIDREVPYGKKNENLGYKGSPGGHVTILWEFRDPLHISAMVEARNSKFGTQNDREDPHRKKMKISVKRGYQGVT